MKNHAIWLFARDMGQINFEELKETQTTDIFLNFFALTDTYKQQGLNFIKKCKEEGIRVSLWTQALYMGGEWFNPSTAKGRDRVEVYLKDVEEWIKIDGIDGIHMDYIRYGGTGSGYPDAAIIIANIVKRTHDIVKAEKPEAILTAAVMAEEGANARVYGQDYKLMGEYLDAHCPMTYTGNYNAGTGWLERATKYIVDNCDCEVWAGLQTYASDSNLAMKGSAELVLEAKAAEKAGAKGIVHFRYGLINSSAWKSVGEMITPEEVEPAPEPTPEPDVPVNVASIEEVLDASKRVRNFIEERNRSPNTVRVGDEVVERASFNRMMAATLLEIESGRRWNILRKEIEPPANPTGNLQSANLEKKDYLDAAQRALAFMMNNERMPNTIMTPFGNASPFNFIDMYARVLAFYEENEMLPNFVRTQRGVTASPPASGTFLARLRSAMGFNFTNATELYNRVRNYPYAYYYNSRYNEAQRLDRIRNRQGMNCTDWSLVLYKAIQELGGYQIHAVRGLVACRTRNIGHVWLEIRGREFSNWIFYDSTTATSSKGSINRLVCPLVRGSRTYNPTWFMNLL